MSDQFVSSSCQMPNCHNLCTKKISKSGVFAGIHIDDISLKVCNDHSIQEVNQIINAICEEKAVSCQLINPYMEIAACLSK